MNTMTLSQGQQPVSRRFRVDVSRGQRIGRVSSEWFSRPDDERYLNLPELYEAVRGRAERAQARTVESRAIRVEANRDNPERLALSMPGRDEPVAPTLQCDALARRSHVHRRAERRGSLLLECRFAVVQCGQHPPPGQPKSDFCPPSPGDLPNDV